MKRIGSFLFWSCLAALGLHAEAPRLDTTASLSMGVGFDDNLYLQDDGPLAAGQSVASVPAREFSGVVMAKLSLATKDTHAAWPWAMTYSPEAFNYLEHAEENHVDHRWAFTAGRTSGAWKTALKFSGVEIDGSKEGLVYNRLGGGPPIGGVPVRARRAQGQYKGGASLAHAWEKITLRAVANAAATDFRTEQRNQTGYSNYVDRSEWDAGLDGGRKLGSAFWFVGLRTGEQRQKNLLGVRLNTSSEFVRVLAGLEGKLGEHWTLAAAAGLDRRSMDADRLAGSERVRSEPYADVTATRALGANDTLVLSFKQGVVLAGSGKTAYLDSLGDVSWKHQWSPKWDTALGANFDYADFKDMISSVKREWIATLNATAGWAVSKQARLEIGLTRDWSDSRIPATPGREYHRWQGRFAGVWKW